MSSLLRGLALGLFSHRFLAQARWELHFIRVRVRNRLTGRHRALRQFVRTMPEPRYLNLGSGPRGSSDPHWLNVDGFTDKNVHFLLDLSRPIPIEDAVLDGVFCEHVMEHFSLEDGERLAREVLRTLKPGGVFRIVVPDAERIVRTYSEAPQSLVKYRLGSDRDIAQPGSTPEVTPMAVVNLFFRQGYEHHFLYDWQSMDLMLRRAGFAQVERAQLAQSKFSQRLVLDDPKYGWESLYVEARKATGPGKPSQERLSS